MQMTRRTVRALAGSGTAVATALGLCLTALPVQAVSGGGYNPQQQGCSPSADRNDQPGTTQPGCHNATLQANDGPGGYGNNWHVLSINSDQLPEGASPHSGSVVVDPGRGESHTLTFDTGQGNLVLVSPLGLAVDLLTWAGSGFQGPAPIPQQLVGSPGTPSARLSNAWAPQHSVQPGNGGRWQVYFGADDNLDNGEHDGVNPSDFNGQDAQLADGPSDGGAVQANTHPNGQLSKPGTLIADNVDPTDAHDPVRAADAGTGACADGFCAGADTMRRRDYQGGCTSCPDQSVYSDQYTTQWRSPDCNGQSTQNENECGADWQNGNEQGNIYQPYSERGAYYTDPGVFVYSDPDPQASPEFPVTPTYPMCELYAGTMGVWVCSQNVVPSPVEAFGGADRSATGTVHATQQHSSAVHAGSAAPVRTHSATGGSVSASPSGAATTPDATPSPAPSPSPLVLPLPLLPAPPLPIPLQ